MDERARLPLLDLAPLGIFLYGPRWQSALARDVHRTPRMVRRWVAGERPISVDASRLIAELVRNKHAHQMRWIRASYLGMVTGLSTSVFRAGLLAMDAGEVSAAPRPVWRSDDATAKREDAPHHFAPHHFEDDLADCPYRDAAE